MARRFVVANLEPGKLTLDERQGAHLRDVLRLAPGAIVELFDSSGRSASARVLRTTPAVELEVQEVRPAAALATKLIIAAAVPKGTRADWMIEKLSELGVATYIPLETQRSVVHPESAKLRRWARISQESAKQCKRPGVMQISAVSQINALAVAPTHEKRLCLSTQHGATPVMQLAPFDGTILAAIGPEGGWTEQELGLLRANGFAMAGLTGTVLRIETAAIAIAAVIMAAANEKEI